MSMRFFFLLSFSLVLFAASPVIAEESVILVLDGSGSMWGQIEGKAKIAIAREVVHNIIESLPADRALGLVAYGHNRKGDCEDIEEIAAIGARRDVINKAVDNIKPKGKTPLSAAVVFAAENSSIPNRKRQWS